LSNKVNGLQGQKSGSSRRSGSKRRGERFAFHLSF
jgi:hypothetical protein